MMPAQSSWFILRDTTCCLLKKLFTSWFYIWYCRDRLLHNRHVASIISDPESDLSLQSDGDSRTTSPGARGPDLAARELSHSPSHRLHNVAEVHELHDDVSGEDSSNDEDSDSELDLGAQGSDWDDADETDQFSSDLDAALDDTENSDDSVTTASGEDSEDISGHTDGIDTTVDDGSGSEESFTGSDSDGPSNDASGTDKHISTTTSQEEPIPFQASVADLGTERGDVKALDPTTVKESAPTPRKHGTIFQWY